jgi:hypothetical protein
LAPIVIVAAVAAAFLGALRPFSLLVIFTLPSPFIALGVHFTLTR